MLETILLLEKENYQKLKWVNQFVSTDPARPVLNCVHIMGSSLVGADGFSIGRIDIPDVLKDYCEGKEAFTILKLVTSPYLAVLETISDDVVVSDIQKNIATVIESTSSTTTEENRATSASLRLFKRLNTMPGMSESVDLYSKSLTAPFVAVSDEGYAIIMPMHKPGDPVYDRAVKEAFKKKVKLTKKGAEFVKGVDPKKED